MSAPVQTPSTARRLIDGLTRRKSVEAAIGDVDRRRDRILREELSAVDIVMFGISVLVGAGIFSNAAAVVRDHGAAETSIAFVVAAVGAGAAGLCYAEFSSTVPVAGSAYTSSYVTFGELVAWVVGWDLTLEYALGAAVVAKTWSAYLAQTVGVPLGAGTVDWPAAVLIVFLTAIIYSGIRISNGFNILMSSIKVGALLLVIAAGLVLQPGPVTLPTTGRASPPTLLQAVAGQDVPVFGLGVLATAAVLFFGFIGFDVVSTAAEETRAPQRNLPRGVLGSLAVVTVLYVATALSLPEIRSQRPPPGAPTDTATDTLAGVMAPWAPTASTVVSVAVLVGLVSVPMLLLLGQSRTVYVMARDGLLPRRLTAVTASGSPGVSTLVVGVLTALVAGWPWSSDDLLQLANIGTLFAFVLVSLATVVLRRLRPDLPRLFRTPWLGGVALVAVVTCAWLMINLPVVAWLLFVGWLGLGVLIYVGYSRWHADLHADRAVPWVVFGWRMLLPARGRRAGTRALRPREVVWEVSSERPVLTRSIDRAAFRLRLRALARTVPVHAPGEIPTTDDRRVVVVGACGALAYRFEDAGDRRQRVVVTNVRIADGRALPPEERRQAARDWALELSPPADRWWVRRRGVAGPSWVLVSELEPPEPGPWERWWQRTGSR